TQKAVAGMTFLRAVHCPEQGRTLFSDAISFTVQAGMTNEFDLELKPGASASGRLDPIVPRPVRNGRVCIRLFMKDQDGNSAAPVWLGWRTLSPDGAFTFESLPQGRLEIIGLCDGFLSRNGPPLQQGRTTSQRLPQSFTLDGQDQ